MTNGEHPARHPRGTFVRAVDNGGVAVWVAFDPAHRLRLLIELVCGVGACRSPLGCLAALVVVVGDGVIRTPDGLDQAALVAHAPAVPCHPLMPGVRLIAAGARASVGF